MINQLTIRNFQSHKRTTLNFHEGVNVIMGRSDSGKTAIIRALRWVTKNKPNGDAFRSTWGGQTEVTIHTEHDEITRMKNDKENGYRLNIQTAFNAIQTNIPDEISHALNMDEINMQSQFDRPFLLDSSAGEVANHFNRIAHIDQIDSSIKKVQAFIRNIEQDIKVKESLIETYQANQELYQHLDKFEANVEVLEGMESNFTQLCTASAKLKSLAASIMETKWDIEKYDNILEIEGEVSSLLQLITEKEEQERVKGNLIKSIEIISGVFKGIKTRQTILLLEPDIDMLLDLYSKKRKEINNRDAIEDLILAVKQAESSIKTKQATLDTQQAKFKANFPDICPLCETHLKVTINSRDFENVHVIHTSNAKNKRIN